MFEETEENSTTSLLDGLVISNRYEVIRCLGSGAMGSVHLARDRLLSGNVVALKVLKRQIADEQNVRQRFLQEVKLMHRVNHPNVVRTYDVGVDHDLIYFTMEYVTGISLEKLVQEGGINLDLFIDISLQICAGLGQIHAADIIHRDLKPANVMLSDGKVKIADFGVARSSRSELTQHKEIIGSTPYIAPEIWMGGKLTSAADFYSLGAIFFELLIGHAPFEHDIPATIMWMHLKKSPEEPKSLRPEIPEWLNAMILRMLAKSPENRPSSAEEIYNYIQKRAKISKANVKDEKSEIERSHFCSLDAEVISNLANNWEDQAAAVCSSNSELFLVSTAPKSFDKNSYTGLVIKEYVANAFNSDGLLTTETLSNALNAANNILLLKRRERSDITGISASLAALAITPNEILLSFAGSCVVFIATSSEFVRLTGGFPTSSSWALGTTLPLTTETHKIKYNPTQPMRILLTTQSILDCLGEKEIENTLRDEDFSQSISSLVAEAEKHKPHFSTALLLIELNNNPPHNIEVSPGKLSMSIFSYDQKSNEMKISDYSAFFNQDELDKTYKPLVFDEIEKPKNILFEDLKESIIFKSLPSTDEIIKQQESLAQFSKHRLKKIKVDVRAKEHQKLIENKKTQNKILIAAAVSLVLISMLTIAALFKLNKQRDQKIQTNSVEAGQSYLVTASTNSKFVTLVNVSNQLRDLSLESNVEIKKESKNSLLAKDFDSNDDLKLFAKDINVDALSLFDVLSGIEKFNSITTQSNHAQIQNELKLADLEVELKAYQSRNMNIAKNNLIATQREFHTLTEIIKSVSPYINNQKKRFVFWHEYARGIGQNKIISLAQELASRKWIDSPRTIEAQATWQKYVDLMNSDAEQDIIRRVVLAKLNSLVSEVVQIGTRYSSWWH